jgi:hypothetical protein
LSWRDFAGASGLFGRARSNQQAACLDEATPDSYHVGAMFVGAKKGRSNARLRAFVSIGKIMLESPRTLQFFRLSGPMMYR